MDIEKTVQTRLFEMQDEKYRKFQAGLMPTVPVERIIGVRTPLLRKYAAEIFKTDYWEDFIKILPHKYYEENNLHGFIIEKIKDFDRCIEEIEKFLPCVDNWATCDCVSPKVFKKSPERLIPYIKKWIDSGKTYHIRFAISMLMTWFLDERFDTQYLDLAVDIKSDEYYVNMMRAWYFATALAKQYDQTVEYIQSRRLDVWTHNKTIRKAIESYRITPEQKEYLRSFTVK